MTPYIFVRTHILVLMVGCVSMLMPKEPVLSEMKRQIRSQPVGADCATHWVRKPPSGMRAVRLLVNALGTCTNI